MRSLGKKPHFWPSQRRKKVLLTSQGCARLRTGPIIMQIPRGYQKKSLLCRKAICAILREKNPILCAILRLGKSRRGYQKKKPHFGASQGCALPSKSLGRKKSLLCRKARVRSLGKKPHFWPSQRLKKVLLTAQGCARLRTGPIIMQIPRGYQKKKFIV